LRYWKSSGKVIADLSTDQAILKKAAHQVIDRFEVSFNGVSTPDGPVPETRIRR
jgi:hypothetical protein